VSPAPEPRPSIRSLEEAERAARKAFEAIKFPFVGGGKSAQKVEQLKRTYNEARRQAQAHWDAAKERLKAAYAQAEAESPDAAPQPTPKAGLETGAPAPAALKREVAKAHAFQAELERLTPSDLFGGLTEYY
jgi:hypothetical protein